MRGQSTTANVVGCFAAGVTAVFILYDISELLPPAGLGPKSSLLWLPLLFLGLFYWGFFRRNIVNLPPASRRGTMGYFVFACFCFVIGSLLTVSNLLSRGVGFAVMEYVCLGVFVAWCVSMNRLKRAVKRYDYACCVFCTYSLAGLPVRGKCPECGNEYRIDECHTKWRHWAKGVW